MSGQPNSFPGHQLVPGRQGAQQLERVTMYRDNLEMLIEKGGTRLKMELTNS